MSSLTRRIYDVDVTRPTTPGSFTVTAISATRNDLAWSASSDPPGGGTQAVTGVVGYRVYRDGSLIASPTSLSYSDTGLTEYTIYAYQVAAVDGAGNESIKTAVVNRRTLDATAPTAPTITASASGQTTATVALTAASTDAGSGIASYRLERKLTSDSTWTVLSSNATFPYSDTGLTAATSYDYRARATDVAGNAGAYSTTSTTTTQSAGGSLTWATSVPTQSLFQNASASVDLKAYITSGTATGFAIASGTLPAGLSLNTSTGVITGTPTTVGSSALTFIASDNGPGDADWAARSAGAIYANRLETSGAIASVTLQDDYASHLSLDTTIKPSGAAGSLRFAVLNSDDAQSGNARIQYPQTFGAGTTHWVSYRIRVPADCAFQPWPTPDTTGRKMSILSAYSNSNTPYELVVQDTYMLGRFAGYHQDGVASAVHEELSLSTSVNGSDFASPGGINRAVRPHTAGGASYPLTGTNPDTGSAWSTYQQERAQYGELYSARAGNAADLRDGLGDPISGAFRCWPDEWITVTQRVIVGSFGSFNSRWTCWAARDGQPYVLLWDSQNIRIGGPGPYSGMWLLPYVTNRSPGGRKVSSRTNAIPGVTIATCGLSTPIGNGTLTYNATTQRFTWAGSGESAGTARGHSAANGKLWLNVISGGASDSYLVIKVDPALLPTSGTTSETVAIANGRPDTFVNYADVIISTNPINAPGGHAPT